MSSRHVAPAKVKTWTAGDVAKHRFQVSHAPRRAAAPRHAAPRSATPRLARPPRRVAPRRAAPRRARPPARALAHRSASLRRRHPRRAPRALQDDCWVSAHGTVFDLTPLLSAEAGFGTLCDPLIAAAGGDVSHWFDEIAPSPATRAARAAAAAAAAPAPQAGGSGSGSARSVHAATSAGGAGASAAAQALAELELKWHVEPATGLRAPYCAEGAFVHVPRVAPSAEQDVAELALPWWRDERFVAGRLTARARRVRVVNSLTSHEHVLEMGVENTVEDLQARYLEHNAHCGSYSWKALVHGAFRPLDVHKTLEENGVLDDAEELDRLGMDADAPDFLIDLIIAFNDDLTVA